MNRRKLLKSTVMAGAGVILTGNTVSAVVSNAGSAGEADSQNGGSTILTKKRTLGSGKAALTVSGLSLGCMGMQAGRGIVPDEKRMETLIRQAYDRGCNFFDTAWVYGQGRSERLLGRLLRARPDTRLYCASKVPPRDMKWPAGPDSSLDDTFPPDHIRAFRGAMDRYFERQ